MKTCYIYDRVSSVNQAKFGFSIEAQELTCREFANKTDYKVMRVFIDGGESATTDDRTNFQEMLNVCEDSPVDAIIVYNTDRFARNEHDHFFYKKLLKKLKIQLISVAQPMLDESPEGQLLDTVLAGVNAFYSRDLSRKTKKGMNQKWKNGDYPGWAPLGYVNGDKEKSEKPILLDPLKGPLVKDGLELFSTGDFTILKLQEWFFEHGLTSKTGKMLQYSVVHWMLQNPFYYGLMRRNGEERMGNHEPLITQETYDLNQFILRRNDGFKVRRRKHNFLLRGFAFCNVCGLRYVAEWHDIKPFAHNNKKAYYHCAIRKGGCKSANIETGTLEIIVENQFKKLQFKQEFIDLINQKTKDIFLKKRENIDGDKQAIINQKKAIEVRRNTLEDRLLDNTITREIFQRKHQQIQGELSALDKRLFELEHKREEDVVVLDEILSFSRNIYETYKSAPTAIKQSYLQFFFNRFLVENKKLVKVEHSLLFETLLREQKIILISDWLPS